MVALPTEVPDSDSVWSVVIWSVDELPVSSLIEVKAGTGGGWAILDKKASVPPPLLDWNGEAVGQFVDAVDPTQYTLLSRSRANPAAVSSPLPPR